MRRAFPELAGPLALAVVLSLLVGAPIESREPSSHSTPYNFTTVLVPRQTIDTSYFIDDTDIYTSPGSTLEPERHQVSVPSVKPVEELKSKTFRTAIAGSAISGKASYYCCTNGYSDGSIVGAACGKLRDAMGPSWKGQTVTVSGGGQQVAVKLVDWCGSRDKLIDLHPGAFTQIGPLSRGVLRVTVGW